MISELKFVFRKIRSDKTFSTLIVASLALAFCVAIPLVCKVAYHRSFDKFHPAYNRVCNVYINEVYRGEKDTYSELPLVVGEYLQKLFPEIEDMVRIKDNSDNIIAAGKNDYWKEDVIWTEPSFLNIFSIDLQAGDRGAFLSTNDGAYVSRTLATKIFKKSDPVGKEIRVNDATYLVAGVFKDYPGNSHLKFSVLLPLERFISHEEKYKWDNYEFLTYIKLTPNANFKHVEKKIQTFITKYWVPWVKENYNLDYAFNNKNSIDLRLIAAADIHLQGSFISSFEKGIKSSEVNINLSIVLILLFIAYFNITGFAVSKRKKQELALKTRRCMGAKNQKLVSTFVLENITYTTLAFVLALMVTLVTWRFYTELDELKTYFTSIILLYLVALAIGIVAGYFIGFFFIKRQSPLTKTKNEYSGLWINRVLIISQMAASVILLISISFIFKQIDYISNFNLGIDTKNIVVVSHASKVRNKYEAFKNELKKSPLIKEVACSNSYPFLWANSSSYIHANSKDLTPYPFLYFRVDAGFSKIFNIKTFEGEWFSEETGSAANGIILSEGAVKTLNMKHPLGEELYKTDSPNERFKVTGVVKNFHFQSLHHTIAPLLLCPIKENDWWNFIEIKGTTADRTAIMAEIKRTWDKFAPNTYFDCIFLEDRIALMYEKEQKAKRTMATFSLVAILLSCCGLLGIVLNTITEKTKEIGIRKVNGSRTIEVMAMLNRNFIKWVAIAFVIACPIAWYAMQKWLENFAYKTELSWWVFAAAGAIAMVIALVTVSWQSWRAATRNPVESLRYE